MKRERDAVRQAGANRKQVGGGGGVWHANWEKMILPGVMWAVVTSLLLIQTLTGASAKREGSPEEALMSRSSVCSWRHPVAAVQGKRLIVKRKRRKKEGRGGDGGRGVSVCIKLSQTTFPPPVCHQFCLLVLTYLIGSMKEVVQGLGVTAEKWGVGGVLKTNKATLAHEGICSWVSLTTIHQVGKSHHHPPCQLRGGGEGGGATISTVTGLSLISR